MYQAIRDVQNKIISDNPSTITITRTSKELVGGAWQESTEELASQTVRIYAKTVAVSTLNTTIDEGGWSQSLVHKMLASYDADVQRKTADNTDTFEANNKTYEILDVVDISTAGEIVFKICHIREVEI